jgi:hypothetical protein
MLGAGFMMVSWLAFVGGLIKADPGERVSTGVCLDSRLSACEDRGGRIGDGDH